MFNVLFLLVMGQLLLQSPPPQSSPFHATMHIPCTYMFQMMSIPVSVHLPMCNSTLQSCFPQPYRAHHVVPNAAEDNGTEDGRGKYSRWTVSGDPREQCRRSAHRRWPALDGITIEDEGGHRSGTIFPVSGIYRKTCFGPVMVAVSCRVLSRW